MNIFTLYVFMRFGYYEHIYLKQIIQHAHFLQIEQNYWNN